MSSKSIQIFPDPPSVYKKYGAFSFFHCIHISIRISHQPMLIFLNTSQTIPIPPRRLRYLRPATNLHVFNVSGNFQYVYLNFRMPIFCLLYFLILHTTSFQEPDLPLETYGIERLYKINNEDDYTKEFRRINQELRECVLKILNALGNKESTRDVILRSKSILINMHHLLNEYRPIQAKKLTLIRLKEQIKANEVALKDMADVIVLAKEKLRNK